MLSHSPDPPDDPFAGLEVKCECGCGDCCRSLIVEADLEDAEREPRIKELGSPLLAPAELTESGQPEVEGYLLNGEDGACVFLEQETSRCSIYETRPLACRLFDCGQGARAELIALGVFERGRSGAEQKE